MDGLLVTFGLGAVIFLGRTLDYLNAILDKEVRR